MSVDSFHTSGHSPGPDFDKPAAVFPTASRCRVGLPGFGTVGSAVARRLAFDRGRGLDLTRIFDRRAHQKRDRSSSGGPGGTVLSRMEATGCTMEQAVADARAEGYAELDPSDDLDGLDAAAKLVILCAIGLGLGAPRSIVGLEAAKNVLVTTSCAEFAEPAESASLCGPGSLCVDRLEAEAV
jgi:homoserine dehydrogenase